jgi:D-aminopeptidase
MKILIAVDIEGIAGVVHPEQVRPGNPEYERARRQMTAEANAAVEGAFDGGATAVIVNDSHGDFRNLLAEEIDGRAELLLGKPRELGIPVALMTGDDVFVAETTPQYPGAVAVTLKRAHGNRVATSLSPHAACAAVREAHARPFSEAPLCAYHRHRHRRRCDWKQRPWRSPTCSQCCPSCGAWTP